MQTEWKKAGMVPIGKGPLGKLGVDRRTILENILKK